MITQLFPKQTFDFGDLANSQTLREIIIRALDVQECGDAILCVRVHAVDIGTGSLEVQVHSTAPTVEEPDADFVAATAAASATVDSTSSAGDLVCVGLSAGFAAALRVSVLATQGSSGGNLSADLSAELVLRKAVPPKPQTEGDFEIRGETLTLGENDGATIWFRLGGANRFAIEYDSSETLEFRRYDAAGNLKNTTSYSKFGAWTVPTNLSLLSAAPILFVGNNFGNPSQILRKASAGHAYVYFRTSTADVANDKRLHSTDTETLEVEHYDGTSWNAALIVDNNADVEVVNGLTVGDEIFLQERAAAPSTSAGQGALWARDDTPTTLMWTDDAGNSHPLSSMDEIIINAADFVGVSSDHAATIGTYDLSGSGTRVVRTIQFPHTGSHDEDYAAMAVCHLPANYAGGGLTVQLTIVPDGTVSTESVVFGVAIDRNQDGSDATTDSYDTEKTTTASLQGTDLWQVVTIDLTHADLDGLLAGGSCLLRLRRLRSNASDDFSNDIHVLDVRISETVT